METALNCGVRLPIHTKAPERWATAGTALRRVRITVPVQEAALRYRDGRLVDVLGPGRHQRMRRTQLVPVSLRKQLSQTATQEVQTSDGITLKATAVFVWSVSDPVGFHEVTSDPIAVVYLAIQVALRDALTELDVDTAMSTGRRAIAEALTSSAARAGETVGVRIEEVVLKDLVLPLELRSAYAALVATRQRGKAQLEEARAQTAALRSLANGAKLLDDNPALARLQLVQALPPGTSLKLALD